MSNGPPDDRGETADVGPGSGERATQLLAELAELGTIGPIFVCRTSSSRPVLLAAVEVLREMRPDAAR